LELNKTLTSLELKVTHHENIIELNMIEINELQSDKTSLIGKSVYEIERYKLIEQK